MNEKIVFWVLIWELGDGIERKKKKLNPKFCPVVGGAVAVQREREREREGRRRKNNSERKKI